ncbi:MAG: hypothetical protein KA099_06535 [Alphaproteobacteria bacterium]|nr:hypothetical protein [Alphaproteobacteria bacterium]MBP7758622.1 hypothetical protein [Alphaproteobacteria bacterium]MBP7763367.1 hypothetical protein [Alphaproteobacteria bacterium]MBP7904966.1 hypothetical protein [Alphaproteobacteria bacterium]
MLRDFWLLETYFGPTDAAQTVEEVIKRYGAERFRNALQAGHITLRSVFLRPDGGRTLCALSEKGREAAHTRNPPPHPEDQPV